MLFISITYFREGLPVGLEYWREIHLRKSIDRILEKYKWTKFLLAFPLKLDIIQSKSRCVFNDGFDYDMVYERRYRLRHGEESMVCDSI